MSAVEAREGAVRVCATCGLAMTLVGADGECMRCLVSFGFLSEEQQPEALSSPSNAQDVVQGFFQHLLERNTLSGADQEKGRLRPFLLGALQNYLLKQHERMSALKRGGGKQMVSLDDQIIEAEAAMHATMHLNEVSSYDAAWASSIVARAWKNVRERFAADGKREWFDALRPFVACGTAQPPDEQEIAERLGTTVVNLRVLVTSLRQRYRHALRAEVASTVSDPKDIDSELHYLYQVLTS